MARVHVVGHINPDTDSIAAAVGHAWFLSHTGEPATAGRAGALNGQTRWVLDRLGVDPPQLMVDVSVRFEAVTRRLNPVAPDATLADAWAVASRSSVVPVVDEAGRPAGLITGLSLFAHLSRLVGPHPDRTAVTLQEIFDGPCIIAADGDVPRFSAGARIRDALPRILRDERDDFWIVDADGAYLGICRKPDLLDPPRVQLVLVDHNEARQSVAGLDEAVLLEVLDHHRLDSPPTRLPIRFSIDPVGSTSTLVAERLERASLQAPAPLAGLLLAGVLSDTLALISPTTTARDRDAAVALGRLALVPGGPLDGETVESFGRQLLQAGAGLESRDPEQVVSADLKHYDAGGRAVAVAQVEVTDLSEVATHRAALMQALSRLRTARGLALAVLMVTDVVGGSSQLLISGEGLEDLPYARLPDGTFEARGVVSRKKQLLPLILARLE